ncbi:MAG: hypothetical protein JW967_05720 [Dehalococcoidales bacterium]|nr:hypothetical protein [Dehalococcoidales bacterium]
MMTLSIPIPAASAGMGITVSGALLEAEVAPGDVLTHKITVTLGTNELLTDATARVGELGQKGDGTCILIDNPTCRFSAREYISLDKYSIQLQPGMSQDIVATIRIPKDVGEGGRYALINIQTQPAGDGNIGIVSAFNIPVYLTVRNTEVINQGKIISIATGEITSGEPIPIITTFQNTGNYHYKTKSEVKIADATGEILDTIYSGLTATSVIPEMCRENRVLFIPGKELLPGDYEVYVNIIAEDGTLIDEGKTKFEIRVPLLPPTAPVVQTVMPAESALLQTDGGTISIDFPQGSVTAPIDITVRDYPTSQLPPLPSKYQATTICFRIDGISGLLLEQATVTVKYSQSDLEKADGDASRLKLAYWDEVTGSWTILKTSADTAGMTLTAATNHFSIWTVTVIPATNVTISAIIGAVAICAFAIFGGSLLLFKKKEN